MASSSAVKCYKLVPHAVQSELQNILDTLLLDAPRRSVLVVDQGRLEPDQGAKLRWAFREVDGCHVRSFEVGEQRGTLRVGRCGELVVLAWIGWP